ncbi:MAG: hypothetical protein HY059_10090 [Proteobacteria bacterium]|nr:hypothetical protein [Pseudomonadota bacterium]
MAPSLALAEKRPRYISFGEAAEGMARASGVIGFQAKDGSMYMTDIPVKPPKNMSPGEAFSRMQLSYVKDGVSLSVPLIQRQSGQWDRTVNPEFGVSVWDGKRYRYAGDVRSDLPGGILDKRVQADLKRQIAELGRNPVLADFPRSMPEFLNLGQTFKDLGLSYDAKTGFISGKVAGKDIKIPAAGATVTSEMNADVSKLTVTYPDAKEPGDVKSRSINRNGEEDVAKVE